MSDGKPAYPRYMRSAFAFVEGAGTGDQALIREARRLFKGLSVSYQLRTCAVLAIIAAGALRQVHGDSWRDHVESVPDLGGPQ